MIDKYMYLVLGILLGIGIALYFFASREEKIEETIKRDKKIYSSERLDLTMENVVDRINDRIKEVRRELTEDEKNEIIIQCYKDKFTV